MLSKIASTTTPFLARLILMLPAASLFTAVLVLLRNMMNPSFRNLPVFDPNHPVGHQGDFLIMGNHNHRLVKLPAGHLQ